VCLWARKSWRLHCPIHRAVVRNRWDEFPSADSSPGTHGHSVNTWPTALSVNGNFRLFTDQPQPETQHCCKSQRCCFHTQGPSENRPKRTSLWLICHVSKGWCLPLSSQRPQVNHLSAVLLSCLAFLWGPPGTGPFPLESLFHPRPNNNKTLMIQPSRTE